MNNKIVHKILLDCAKEETTPYWYKAHLPEYDHFAQQVVGETILAALAADVTSFVRTTYDKHLADAVLNRVVDSIRNHWSFAQP